MRFCGMCGTPLPHAPLTAPGAHSTLNFTRVPLDNKASAGQQSTSVQDRGGVLLEMPAAAREGTSAETPIEPPAKELVPDVPLNEYVENFHYEPPSEPTEITMRGDGHVGAHDFRGYAEADHEQHTVADNIIASSNVGEFSSPPVTTAAPDEDVDSRLGLEPETPIEAEIPRPRFLDINPPPKEAPPANSGMSTITGPSFLGLSDSPQTWSEAVGVPPGEYAPRKSHWRLWLALVVLVVFAGLGWLEWQSQVNRTDNGPVEVIRAKVRSLQQSSQSASAPVAGDNDTKPTMQVTEPAKAPEQKPDGAESVASPNPPPNANATPATTAPEQNPKPSPAAQTPVIDSKNTTPASIASSKPEAKQPAAANSKTKREADTAAQEVTTKQNVPGADEMSKANNASDAAAEAAWLWKATAKGNPDAPVQLADMYVKGEGVPRSCEQALVLLKSAAIKENAHARNRLASMYATGNCVQRNRVEAYRWVSSALSANPHSEWAQQNRDLLWEQMTPDERIMARKYR